MYASANCVIRRAFCCNLLVKRNMIVKDCLSDKGQLIEMKEDLKHD